MRSNRAGFTLAQRAYTLRFCSRPTIHFAINGNTPSSTNEPSSAGLRMPWSESICASCVPAFTYTSVPASMPIWLTA
ncbi:hypothetical protein D9M68_828080 [compost metagenome]